MHRHHLPMVTDQLPKACLVLLQEIGELRNNDTAFRAFGATRRQSVNHEPYQLVLSISSWEGAHDIAGRSGSAIPRHDGSLGSVVCCAAAASTRGSKPASSARPPIPMNIQEITVTERGRLLIVCRLN